MARPTLQPFDDVILGTHYVVVSEFDADDAFCAKHDDFQKSGPLVLETYLSPETSTREGAARRAQQFQKLGRIRVARLVFDNEDGTPGLDQVAAELLEALKDLRDNVANETIELWERVDAAIAKAEGRAE